MPRPKALPKTKATKPHTCRPDIDKLTRSVLDALTHVFFTDDAYVNECHSVKRYAEIDEPPGVAITVSTVERQQP